jgi:hypothetical protein
MTNHATLRPASLLAATILAHLLQACASTSSPPRTSGTATPPPIRQAVTSAPRDPQIVMVPGLEGVLGATAGQLAGQFGTARLDVWEGDARKLQFTGTACVLDIYLYPTRQSREPIATHVDARRASDAMAVDRAACVEALRGR